jgi:hypothetical protein
MKKIKDQQIWDEPLMRNISDPEWLFDLICTRNFMAEELGKKIPVTENRSGYKKLKKLLIPSPSKQ